LQRRKPRPKFRTGKVHFDTWERKEVAKEMLDEARKRVEAFSNRSALQTFLGDPPPEYSALGAGHVRKT
jgi:hypothetical protein